MKDMRKTLMIILWLAGAGALFAQQEPQLTMYMFNKAAINPAASGVRGAICATGFARSQWIGMQDMDGNNINPLTMGATIDMPIYKIRSGAGLTVQYDKLGFEKTTDIRLQYAYHQVFSNNHMLSGGISLAMKSKSIDYSQLKPMGEDPALPGDIQGSGMLTDMGFGLHYNIPRKFYAGFSISNLFGSSKEIDGPDYQLARHYYLMAGYDIQVLDRKRRVPWQVTPGFLLKAAAGSVQVDLNAIVTYNDLFWGGVVFRVERAVGIMAGINYYSFQAGVSYDYTLNNFVSGKSRSSIEFFVKYCYPIYPGVVKRSAYNTRDL